MGLMAKILGLDLGSVASGVAGAVDRFVETPDEKKAAQLLIAKMEHEKDKWQTEINRIESGHRSIFIAGWRPLIGYICACALAWGWIIRPILVVAFSVLKIEVEMPDIATNEAISLVMAMLGMSGLRTYEKSKKLTS